MICHRYTLILKVLLLLCLTFSARAQTSLNVASFGGRGDCVQIWASTVSNSTTVSVSASFDASRVGELIELFGVGLQTSGKNVANISTNGNQDFLATIVSVSDGTNLTLDLAPSQTGTNVYCIIGTNNACAFQAAVNAAAGTNTIIHIPAGNFLIIPPATVTGLPANWFNTNYSMISGITIRKGGITFQGEGTNYTSLIGRGAWFLDQNHNAVRSFLFLVRGPGTNTAYPVIWDGMTLDGGLPVGHIGWSSRYPANMVDGLGWDGNHSAIVDSGLAPLPTNQILSNIKVARWRGEMVKSITGGIGEEGFILVTNCFFCDGNATAFNFTFTHTISNNRFENLFQVLEYYQAYTAKASSFQNNYITNISGNGFAINGGTGVNPPYYIAGNTFFFLNGGGGANGIETTPGDNIYIQNNSFYGANYHNAIVLGVAGYQGTFINSNICISGNSFVNEYYVLEIAGGGNNSVANVVVSNNLASGDNAFATGFGWSTNIIFTGNTGSRLVSGQLAGQWLVDKGDNAFHFQANNGNGAGTNLLVYGTGTKWSTPYPALAYAMDNITPLNHLINGAAITITNNSKSAYQLYFNSAFSGAPMTIFPRTLLNVYWNGSAWTMSNALKQLIPPTNLHVDSNNLPTLK